MPLTPITESTRQWVNQVIKDEWNGPISVSKGRSIDTSGLPGFVFVDEGRPIGVVTYEILGDACEICTLNSFDENKGIGSALISAVCGAARELGCKKVFLITTNDNAHAIRFYQKRGFSLINVHIGAMEEARRIKPSIPLAGMDGIPLLHEFEFEMAL